VGLHVALESVRCVAAHGAFLTRKVSLVCVIQRVLLKMVDLLEALLANLTLERSFVHMRLAMLVQFRDRLEHSPAMCFATGVNQPSRAFLVLCHLVSFS
jgi:hypothetical protein